MSYRLFLLSSPLCTGYIVVQPLFLVVVAVEGIHPVVSFVIVLFAVLMISLAMGYWLTDSVKREMVMIKLEIR